jgi:hypothetical protein
VLGGVLVKYVMTDRCRPLASLGVTAFTLGVTAFTLGVTAFLTLFATRAEGQYMAGLKAGYGLGAFTGTTEFQWQAGSSTYSVFASGAITRTLSLQTELYLSEKLGESRVTGSDLSFHATYLTLPLMLRYAPATPGPVKPYFLAGPSLVVQVRCQVRFVTVGLVSVNDCNQTSGDLNSTDVGLEGGAGLELKLGAANLLIEARSATNVGTVVVPTEANSSRSFSWSLMTGFSVPFRARTGARVRPNDRAPVITPISRSAEAAAPLPSLPAETIVEQRTEPPRVENLGQRISVRAIDADARSLLIGIAREAGINLVVSSDVNRRVSLNLVDVPAIQAINEIANAASLTVATPENRALPAVVYYQLPVNVNTASAETISKRFGVSEELAKWIVESRKP